MAKLKQEVPASKQWEIKDRTYFLLHNESPLTYRLASRHSTRYPLLWFDDKKNEQRELRYATNQNSPFVDEQKGEATMGHILFENGVLNVSKEKQNLQKLLSLYHPRKGAIYSEFEANVVAEDEVDSIEAEIEALNLAKDLDIDYAEAILRVEKGSAVADMSSKEVKRDLLLMAKRNPSGFMAIANDENVGLRNTAIKLGFEYVPFDENPYSAMAAWFKTDEGVEVFKTIEKKLQ